MAHNVLDTLPFPASQTAAAGLTLAAPDGSSARFSPFATGVMDSGSATAGGNTPFYDNGTSNNKTYPGSIGKFRPDLAGLIVAVRDIRNSTYQPKLLRCVQLNCTPTTHAGGHAVDAGSGTPGGVAILVQPYYSAAYPTYYTYSVGMALQMGGNTAQISDGRLGVVAMRGGVTPGTGLALPSGLVAAGTNQAPVSGAPSKPLYDGYGPGRALLCGDWVWVVEEGPCVVPVNSGQTATVGYEAQAYSDGSFCNAADNTTVVGTFQQVNNTNAATTVGGFTLQPYQALLMVKRGYQDDTTGGTGV